MVQDILNLFLFRDWRNVIQYGSKLQTELWFAGWLAPMIGWSLQCCSFFVACPSRLKGVETYVTWTWRKKCCEIPRLPYVTICYPLPYTKVLRSKQLPHHPLSTPNWVVQRRRTGSTWNASASGFSHFSSVKSIGGIGHFHIQHISTFTCTWLITRNSKSCCFFSSMLFCRGVAHFLPNHTPNLRQDITPLDFPKEHFRNINLPPHPNISTKQMICSQNNLWSIHHFQRKLC